MLLDVSVMLELREESAPRTIKSLPIKPMSVSWPAADEDLTKLGRYSMEMNKVKATDCSNV